MSDKFRNIYRIPSTRLPRWDYSDNGYYFITICTKERKNYFGEIKFNKMKLSMIGKIIEKFWFEIPGHFSFIELDEFVVMPNHIHGILIINNGFPNVEKRQCLFSTKDVNKKINRFQNQGKHSISSIIGSYKSICTKTINKIQINPLFAWQAGFYDNIIRTEKSFYFI
ncbi:MAG: transposase [bacterium]|nr:transposase [bacterium]